ncbi:MAG: hypothetical protein NVS1B4_07970 [Gemmatimonadaceae bacterium]
MSRDIPHPHPLPPLAGQGKLAVTEVQLESWGESLGRSARPPLVVAIAGELGAGKTTLAKAICRGYGVTADVTSPTFALVHEYSAPRSRVFHLDLYRIRSVAELTDLAWDEIMGSHALILVEWPERAGSRLPPDHVMIELAYSPGDPGRRVLLAG